MQLVPLLSESLPGAPSLPITETWTVADAASTLVGDFPWVDFLGTHAWGIDTNAAQLQGVGPSSPAQGGRLNQNWQVDNLAVTLTLEEWEDTGSDLLVVGPCVRMQADSSVTFYSFVVVAFNGVATCSLQKFLAGVQTQVGPSVSASPSDTMTVGLRVVGPNLAGYVDDVLMVSAYEPTGILTGPYGGMQGVATGTNRVRVASLAIAVAGLAHLPPELHTLQPLAGVH